LRPDLHTTKTAAICGQEQATTPLGPRSASPRTRRRIIPMTQPEAKVSPNGRTSATNPPRTPTVDQPVQTLRATGGTTHPDRTGAVVTGDKEAREERRVPMITAAIKVPGRDAVAGAAEIEREAETSREKSAVHHRRRRPPRGNQVTARRWMPKDPQDGTQPTGDSHRPLA
jgi:hypothetical protein